jgi:hypothetical protein
VAFRLVDALIKLRIGQLDVVVVVALAFSSASFLRFSKPAPRRMATSPASSRRPSAS